ncbi:hypothetical protein ACHAXT_008617 [Thalassiosira profunda]
MAARPSKLTLLSLYAILATLAISRRFVQDVSSQLKQRRRDEAEQLYEQNFLPSHAAPRHNGTANISRSPRAMATATASGSGKLRPLPTFPIKTHIVTHGKPRTATTLLFNMVTVSYFLYLLENDPKKIPQVELSYWQRPKGYKILRESKIPNVIKAHISLDNFLSDNVVVFTAAEDKKEAVEMRHQLEEEGHTVAFVQDMETVKAGGMKELVKSYVEGYGLSETDEVNLNEYFQLWQVLRQCCGQQMSAKWRNDMMPEEFKISHFKSHPTCANYDIDEIEQSFMKTKLFSIVAEYPSIEQMNRPSINDGVLNGTYCSSYNYRVRTEGLSIWGQPGGRPVQSKLDGAIKQEIKKGRENLKPEAYHLFPSSDEPRSVRLRAMFKRTEAEKKAWLKAVLAAREGGKSYEDYKIEPTKASADEVDGSDDAPHEAEEREDTAVARADDDRGKKNRSTATNGFDETHAIFLISFGKEAAESTLVERCILSLRRRGAWDGYIVVLTDAPQDRYDDLDDNVIVMHPRDEHLKAADGTPLKFTRDNTSLKSKRFKTFITEYVGMDTRLDPVELIWYLDIDILAGDAMGDLFNAIERKYEVERGARNEGLSKLFFFTPLSKEWPLQGGTFIVERASSNHCLELWRKEIDDMTKSGRGRDQDGLRNMYERIESGKESKCELVRMDNENFISFPTPRTFDKITRQSSYPGLIHISNSVFAKWIDADEQTKYIHKVLRLTEEEKQSGKYGKSVVHAKKSDM